jgi:hypothetical protein
MDNVQKHNICTNIPRHKLSELMKSAVFNGILKILNICISASTVQGE